MNASMAVRTKGDHELDVTEPPDNYHVCSCDQAGEFLDLIEQFERGDEARALRGGDLRANKLPLTTRYEP